MVGRVVLSTFISLVLVAGLLVYLRRAHEPYSSAGAAYDPASDRWTPTASRGAPVGRSRALIAAVGPQLWIWGGQRGRSERSGAIYDAATERWTPLPWRDSSGPERVDVGPRGRLAVGCGALFDLQTLGWTPLGSGRVPSSANCAWRGEKLWSWAPGTLSSYDLASGHRREIGGAREQLRWPAFLAAGRFVAVQWADRLGHPGGALTALTLSVGAGLGPTLHVFDPAGGSWAQSSLPPDLAGVSRQRFRLRVAEIASQLVFWRPGAAVSYDIATNTMRRIDAACTEPLKHDGELLVLSAPGALLLWSPLHPRRGLRLLAEGRCQPVSAQGVPVARRKPLWAWTGQRLLVFGGETARGRLERLHDGAVYDVTTDRWRPMAPSPLAFVPGPSAPPPATHGQGYAVWSGDRFFVWGAHRGVEAALGWFPALNSGHMLLVCVLVFGVALWARRRRGVQRGAAWGWALAGSLVLGGLSAVALFALEWHLFDDFRASHHVAPRAFTLPGTYVVVGASLLALVAGLVVCTIVLLAVPSPRVPPAQPPAPEA